ncbi:polyphosphoinositide phosphatase [Achroia grisella]|uniref:polyphosphoinositide phosphatase n=1 Tax=Achroia grisella TaxID=688607 RepID=UPI0027D20D50|nr:polyphosphoinositide phosphatase [Achroia grisella]
MSKQSVLFHPIISSIQRIALYETKARFYLIGSNNTQTRFRVLKIDRTESRELTLVDDKVEYNKQEIHQLLNMIGFGNRPGKLGGFNKLVSAFGIVGFIRFLEGYYIILVTKRRKIAVIGSHSIYKIEDTATIYIPSESNKPQHPDEQRYLKMFLAIDLSTNFYYSYSYDITHTLQMNIAPPRQLAPVLFPKPVTAVVHGTSSESCKVQCTCKDGNDDEDIFETWKKQIKQRQDKMGCQSQKLEFGVRSVPEWRFVWNSHLLSTVHSHLHPDWILYIVHGFIAQSNLNIFGRPIYLTLIARRSNRYAGTRFLKRGANIHGDVANEVETEQIIHDSMVSSLTAGRFSSFVQMRGSIPSYWSQDVSKMVPKPAISIDLSDPFAETPGKHLNNLMRRYGAPIMFLNLVKKREKRKHESLLTDVISNAIKYLNQFLPPEHAVQYIHLDMARMNKGADAKVLDKLSAIAHTAVQRTGIFVNSKSYDEMRGVDGHQGGRVQTGLVRVNCVDCLDRTNTAQFAIGKCVLAHQLYALGLIAEPVIEFDSDCVRLLEGLYEDHGDTLALQYGGSQLVHRIKSYRKTAPWASHGNDIMQTLSRYYSNTFSDAEKQNTMNLFLGLFIPDPTKPPIWDYQNDYYLHHPEASTYIPNRRSLTKWWDDDVLRYVPLPCNEMRKLCCEIIGMQGDSSALEMVDPYHDHNRPFEYTVFAECFEFKMCHTRDLAPTFSENFSPFVVRGRTVEHKGPTSKNPVISGRCSTTSNNSSDSNSDSSSDDDLTSSTPSSRLAAPSPLTVLVKILSAEEEEQTTTLFPAIKRQNRVLLKEPNKRDMLIYKRYVNFERRSNPKYKSDSHVVMTVNSAFTIDSSVDVIPPTVTKVAKEIYHNYVQRNNGRIVVSPNSIALYKKYVNFTL